MPKRTIASLQDLAVDNILRQALEQHPAHVLRLLAEVRQGGPSLRDDDVVEVVEVDDEAMSYRVQARHLPAHTRTLLEDLLEHRPMFGTRIRLGDPATASGTDEMDDDVWDTWVNALAAFVSDAWRGPIPSFDNFGEELSLPGELPLPGLGLCVRQLVHHLDHISHVLQLWHRSLIEPDHNDDRFGADAFFDKDDLETLDVARAWPPEDSLWLWRIVGAVGDRAGWDVAHDEDAQYSPEARLLLRKARYAMAVLKAVNAAHDELGGMLLSCKHVEYSMNNWTHSQRLRAPPRVVVQLHWGRERA